MKNKNLIQNFHFSAVFVSLLITAALSDASAQGLNYQFWPSVEVWYKTNYDFRISSAVQTRRNIETKTDDLYFSVQADHSFGNPKKFFLTRHHSQNEAEKLKLFMTRLGFRDAWSIFDEGENYRERMVYGEFYSRLLLKHNILLTQRLRYDNRWIGEDPAYSYRFRYRVMFEREFVSGKTSVAPYVSSEIFWDSRYDQFNRVRTAGGATIAWTKRYSFEGNVTYQYDSKASLSQVIAFNAVFNIYFQSRKIDMVKTDKMKQ